MVNFEDCRFVKYARQSVHDKKTALTQKLGEASKWIVLKRKDVIGGVPCSDSLIKNTFAVFLSECLVDESWSMIFNENQRWRDYNV